MADQEVVAQSINTIQIPQGIAALCGMMAQKGINWTCDSLVYLKDKTVEGAELASKWVEDKTLTLAAEMATPMKK